MELVRLLIEEMVPVLRARGIHKEALAALRLLEESVEERAQLLAIEAALRALEAGQGGRQWPGGRERGRPAQAD